MKRSIVLKMTPRRFELQRGVATIVDLVEGMIAADIEMVMSGRAFQTRRVEADTIRDVEVGTTGSISVLLTELEVKKLSDGSVHRAAGGVMELTVGSQDMTREYVEIPIGPYALVRMRVRDSDGHPVPGREIGITTSPATLEYAVNDQGEGTFLLPPGKYMAYIVGRRSAGHLTGESFVVAPDVEDYGTIELRV